MLNSVVMETVGAAQMAILFSGFALTVSRIPAPKVTLNLLKSAKAAGTIKRIVVTCSINAITGNNMRLTSGKVYTENDWPSEEDQHFFTKCGIHVRIDVNNFRSYFLCVVISNNLCVMFPFHVINFEL